MFVFTVKNMRVGRQAVAVRQAIEHLDRHAAVYVDLEAHEVRIVPAAAGATALSDAMIHAGFDPELRVNFFARKGTQAPTKIPFEGLAHDFSAANDCFCDARANVDALTPTASTPSDGLSDET